MRICLLVEMILCYTNYRVPLYIAAGTKKKQTEAGIEPLPAEWIYLHNPPSCQVN